MSLICAGYAKLEGSKNEDKPYAKVFSMDKNVFEKLINSKAKLNLKLGDKIKLDIGERKTVDRICFKRT